MLALVPLVDPEQVVPPEFLVSALKETGVKNVALARRIGMDTSTVSNWKTGKTPISQARWIAIKAALGLPPNWEPGMPTKALPKPS